MFFRSNSGSGVEYLIVGLGNPEAKYRGTRHNVGFAALDALADRLNIRADRSRFQGLCGQGVIDGHKVLLLKPTTYMNLSGRSVAAAAKFYKVPAGNIIVLSDDINLDPGRLRIRKGGSAGGHNGLKSIIESIGSQDFPRIRIGVGSKPHPDYDLADWVLGTFPMDQRQLMSDTYSDAADAVCLLIREGVEKTASRYNGKSR